MGFFEKFTNRTNISKPNVNLPQKKQPTSINKSQNQVSSKPAPALSIGSQKYIYGTGSNTLETKLKIILKTKPDKLSQLNQKLRSHGLPVVYKNDAAKVAKEIIERRFSPSARKDNKINSSELSSRFENRGEWEKLQKLRREKGMKAYNREKIMDEFFDDLMKN